MNKKEEELSKKTVVRKFRTVQKEGTREVVRQVDHHKLNARRKQKIWQAAPEMGSKRKNTSSFCKINKVKISVINNFKI